MGCFGRTGGSSVDTKATSTGTSTTEKMSPEQKKYFDELLSKYGPQAGVNENIWQGESVAPFSTLQTSAIKNAGNYIDYFSTPPINAETPLFAETGTALKDILSDKTGAKSFTPQDTADYFKGAIYNPTMKSLREDVNPAVDEAFAGPGFFGSARSQERVKAATDTADTLNAQRAALEWDVLGRNQAIEEAKAGRAQTAVGQGIQYSQLPAQQTLNNLQVASGKLGGLGDIFGFGQLEQTQAQVELQSEIASFAEENQITDPENLAILLQLLGMPVTITTTGSETSKSQHNAYENSWKAGDWGSFATQAGALMFM